MNYNFKTFQHDTIAKAIGLDKYSYLINNLYKCNIGDSNEYQTTFNAFFRVRRNKKWRITFYSFF